MKQSTTFACVANKFSKVLQGYTKGIRFVAVLTMLLTMGIGQAWGAEGDLVYTLSFSKLTTGTNFNSYTAAHTITVSSKNWSVVGNQSLGAYLCIGGKNTSNTNRTLYSTSQISSDKVVGKITISNGGTGGTGTITLNSIKLEVASNSTFATIIDTKTINSPAKDGSIDFTPTAPLAVWPKNSYYRITYNYKNSQSNSNGYIKVNNIKFYEGSDPDTNFKVGATLFIQALSSSAWDASACVKAWFNGNNTAATTYWLYDATGSDAGKKMFATIVPTGTSSQVQIQRFASNCNDWWNSNGDLKKSDGANTNILQTNGSGTNNVAWNAGGLQLYLYGTPDSWANSLATFSDQGEGIWTATYSNYSPTATSADFKIKDSYNGWIGNTGSNNNATLSGMVVGSTYDISATLNIPNHTLEIDKTLKACKVHFDMNGHGADIASKTNVTPNSTITAPTEPTDADYKFEGWYKESSCTNQWNFDTDKVTETMTLYAKWTKKVSYTITWKVNNNDHFVGTPTTSIYEGSTYQDLTLPTDPEDSALDACYPQKVFVGWSTHDLGYAETTEPDDLFTSDNVPDTEITANTTFYAVFASKETISGGGAPEWLETDLANITASDVVVITMTYTTDGTVYALSSANGSSSAPTATIVTVSNGALSTEPTDALKWNISNNSGTLTIYPNGTTETWLYCTDTNNGVRVGTNANKAFTIDATSGYLNNTATSRYVGVFRTNPDWRCYTSSTTNIGDQTLAFYKKKETSSTETTGYVTECCTLNNITLDGSGTTTGGTFSATATKACKGEDITLTATAADCYEFVSWTIKKTSDDTDVTNSVLDGNTLTMPDYAVTVYATFKSLSVTEIALSMTDGHKNLDVGETNQLLVTYTPADATCDKAIVSWTSSDDNVISVTNSGLVTALRSGNASITATTAAGISNNYTIVVNNPACTAWYLHYWNASTGGDECFYKVKPDDPNDHEWRTNNFSLPSFSNEDMFNVNNAQAAGGDSQKTDQTFRTGIGFADIRRGGQNCGTNIYPGQDAYGQLSIYDDSNSPNRYIAFYPAQYMVTFGKEGSSWEEMPLNNTTGYEYESEPFMVPNGYKTDDTYKYWVGITDKDGNIKYVGYEFDGVEYKKSSVDAMNTVNGLSTSDMAGKWGVWHIWSNSCANNWYAEFIRYYRVYFNLAGGEGDIAPRYGKAEEPYATFSTSDITEPTRDGYTFLGWKDQNNKIYAPTDATVTINNDLTLTALWVEEYGSDNCRWEEVTIDNIVYGDEVVIATYKNGYTYALKDNDGGASTAPKAVLLTINSNKTINTEETPISNSLIWNIDYDKEGTKNLVIYSTRNAGKWLYSNAANDGVRIGTNANKEFKIVEGTGDDAGNFFLYHIAQKRYLGVYYTNLEWRGYTTINTYITGQTLKFYKKVCLSEGQYRVTWDANGGAWSDGSTTKEEIYTEGATINNPDKPELDGYIFDSWEPTPSTMPAENTTFTAKWAKLHTITWMVGGSELTTGSQTTSVENGKKITAIPANPNDNTLEDCGATKFMGWSTKSSDSTPEDADYYNDLFTTVAESPEITKPTTFYAVFATATTTPGTSTTTNKTYSHTITATTWEANGSQTLNGVSWTLSNNGNYYGYDETKGQQVGSGSKPAKSMTLTTSGFASASKITSVTINTSGASDTNAKVSVKVGGTSYLCNSNTSPSITTTATAYEFTGNSTGDIVISWSQTSSKAIYFKSITVKYSNTTTTPEVTEYSNYVTNCCALAPATNLTVSGTTSNTATLTWTAPSPTTGITKLQVRDENGNVKVDDLAANANTATITGLTECTSYQYYVVSVGDCEVFSNTVTATPFSGAKTVNYDYNGGSGSVASFTTNCTNQTITLPAATRTGYDFNGWYTAATGGTRVGGANDTYEPATSPVTLYAQWTKQIYSISFHANGGTGTMANQKADENNNIAQLNANQFTRTGYAFVGWNTTSAGTGTAYTDQQTNITLAQNLTLYAQWAAIVTLNDAGNVTTTHPETAGGSITLEDGANACDPYEFVGWTSVAIADWNEGIEEPALVTSPYEPTAPITLYAVYKIQSKGNSNAFKLSYEVSGTTYYVGSINSDPYIKGFSNITADNAVTFYKEKIENNTEKYWVYFEKYDSYHDETTKEYLYLYDGNDINTTNSPSETQGWILITLSNGLVQFKDITYDKYFSFTDGGNLTDHSAGSQKSFNLLPAVSSTYYAIPDCDKEIKITFETGNGVFVAHTPTENPLVVTPGETITLPVCEYPGDGIEFIGWLKNTPQEELSDVMAEADVYYEGEEEYVVEDTRDVIFYAYYKVTPEEVEFTGQDDAELKIYHYNGVDNYYYANTFVGEHAELAGIERCFDATTWKFTNVGNMQYYIQDETGQYLGAVSDSDNDFSLSNTPKIWNFTLIDGLWRMICEDSPSRALMYISTGKNFVNAALTNISNSAYSYVTLGICPDDGYTTQPVLSQGFSITNTAMVTSASGQKVKATSALTLKTRNIELPCTFTIAAPNITFYDNTGAEVTQLTASAASEQFELHFAYKPTAENTMEYPTITITDDEYKTYTIKNRIYARSLPATFAIVAKVGNLWYALPSQGLNSTDALVGYPVEVDNPSDPTAVTAVPKNADWSLRQVYASSGSNDRFTANGDNLVFVNNASPAMVLNASSSEEENYLLTDAQYANYYKTNPGLYEWTPTTTDLETYQLTNEQRSRTLSVNTATVFGVHAQNKAVEQVRFLPIQNRYTPAALQVVEWKENSVVIMYNGDPAQTATLAIDGTTAIGSATLNKVNKDVAIYELPASGLMNYATKPLLITIGSSKKWLTIPYIIKNSTTDVNVLNSTSTTKAVAAVTDVVVLDGATFTAAGTKNDKYTFRTIHVYGGGKLVVPASAAEGLGIYSLVMRSGTIENGTYTNSYPQLVMNGKYSNTSGIFLDYITTYERYYALSVPYSVKTKNIKYPADIYGDNLKDGGNIASFALQYYDGKARATGATGWKDFDESGDDPTLIPYQGYTFWGAPRKVSVNGGAKERQKYGIHRIQLTGVGAEDLLKAETSDKTIDIIAYPAEQRPNDMGWNFLGNPYLAQYGGLSADNELVQVGLLEQEMVDGKWTGGWKHIGNLRYITTTTDGQTYTPVEVDKATFSPFNTFFIQAAKDGALQFASASRAQNAPARHYAAQQEAAKEITTGIILTGNDQTDRTGLLIADHFTEEYDFNADLSKFENSGINLYTIGKTGNLAYMAINQALAEQPIPVGYSAPAEGLYTIAFDEDRYNATDISALYLIDYDRNETTNLLHTEYSFVTAAGTNNERFALQVAFIPQNATSVEWVDDATIQVAVDGNNLLLNNLPTDAAVQVFDALGRLMYHAPTVPTDMQLTLPTGYYLVRIANKQHTLVIDTVIP